ncbi:hypothetical protein LY78DRAFT_153300 [Colletotrichum sublineola]|nr:hypothetical protein LY78DRAFT_153300 [Colletotrichum sublineola]
MALNGLRRPSILLALDCSVAHPLCAALNTSPPLGQLFVAFIAGKANKRRFFPPYSSATFLRPTAKGEIEKRISKGGGFPAASSSSA